MDWRDAGGEIGSTTAVVLGESVRCISSFTMLVTNEAYDVLRSMRCHDVSYDSCTALFVQSALVKWKLSLEPANSNATMYADGGRAGGAGAIGGNGGGDSSGYKRIEKTRSHG